MEKYDKIYHTSYVSIVNMAQGVTGENISRIFKDPSFRVLTRLARFFKDLTLAKIFKDLDKS